MRNVGLAFQETASTVSMEDAEARTKYAHALTKNRFSNEFKSKVMPQKVDFCEIMRTRSNDYTFNK